MGIKVRKNVLKLSDWSFDRCPQAWRNFIIHFEEMYSLSYFEDKHPLARTRLINKILKRDFTGQLVIRTNALPSVWFKHPEGLTKFMLYYG